LKCPNTSTDLHTVPLVVIAPDLTLFGGKKLNIENVKFDQVILIAILYFLTIASDNQVFSKINFFMVKNNKGKFIFLEKLDCHLQ
jgi:hypothetical protein